MISITNESDTRIDPLAASEEEQREAYAAALRRELEGVEATLAHLDDPLPDHVVEVPNPATDERVRLGLVNRRKAILADSRQLGVKRRARSTDEACLEPRLARRG